MLESGFDVRFDPFDVFVLFFFPVPCPFDGYVVVFFPVPSSCCFFVLITIF